MEGTDWYREALGPFRRDQGLGFREVLGLERMHHCPYSPNFREACDCKVCTCTVEYLRVFFHVQNASNQQRS